MRPSTAQQRQRLGAIRARKFGSKDHPGWKGLIEVYGVDSIADLNYNQAQELLNVLHGRITPRVQSYKGPGGWRLSQAQADEIARLETALDWGRSPWRLKALIKKLFRNDQKRLFDPKGRGPVGELKKRQASTLIFVLLKIHEREFKNETD